MYRNQAKSVISGAVKKARRRKKPPVYKGPPGSIILQAMDKKRPRG